MYIENPLTFHERLKTVAVFGVVFQVVRAYSRAESISVMAFDVVYRVDQ